MCPGSGQGIGTPFDTASIQEEDIVELCVEVGQTHPKGGLWLLAMELVTLFQSSKAMAWHEEPITLCTSPPSTTHLQAYITGRDGWPSGTQSPTPDGE